MEDLKKSIFIDKLSDQIEDAGHIEDHFRNKPVKPICERCHFHLTV